MSQEDDFDNSDPALPPPLDLSKWRKVPNLLMVIGFVLAAVGWFLNPREFAFSWLLAFMFFLSLCMGAMFLVIAHHLFDAGWSVPYRRFCEHLAALLFPWMAFLFIPIALLAPHGLYAWMGTKLQEHPDHALLAKSPIFSIPGFYIISGACFLVWWIWSNRLRYWSIEQDKTGAARCTYKMRVYACTGIWVFTLSFTMAAILWMKALQHQWYSTMYGVYYFAGSVWLTLATIYVVTMILDRQRIISDVLHEHQYYFLGSLLFAFTVFYAYVTFAQYFIIWNANMPEETFWYVVRERGTWFWVSMVIIFGHFFVPFLALLRIDVKSKFVFMVPLAIWAWLMHFNDMAFNILPVSNPEGFPILYVWLPLGCMAFMGGLLTKVLLKNFASAAPYPIKDPRLIEAMGLYHPVPTQMAGGELDQADKMHGAPIQPKEGH
jgi:hypothetical protein